jgi:hypothetical protein
MGWIRTRHLGILALGLGLSAPAWAGDMQSSSTPLGTLVSSRAPVSKGAELSMGGAFGEHTRWGFATIEGGMPLLVSTKGAGLGLNLRLPAAVVMVPDEDRSAMTLRAVDLEIWGYGRKGERNSFQGGGIAAGLAPYTSNTVFIDTADLGFSIWGFYRGYFDGDGVDLDLGVRLGLNSHKYLIADLSAAVLVEASPTTHISFGVLGGAIQPLWLTAGIRMRPDPHIEVAAGCALPAGQDDDIALCRPFIEVATWSPYQTSLSRRR